MDILDLVDFKEKFKLFLLENYSDALCFGMSQEGWESIIDEFFLMYVYKRGL